MTGQVCEQLHYKGKTYRMNTEPLSGYIVPASEPGAFGSPPEFSPRDSGCWRGYQGGWAIEDGRLYMTGIDGYFADGRKATLEALFPGAPQPVFAKWFSGVLVVNYGKMLRYVHMGYESVYERTLFITVVQGIVTGTELRDNPKALFLRDSHLLFVDPDPADLRALLDGPKATEPPSKGKPRSLVAKRRPRRSFLDDDPGSTVPPRKGKHRPG